MGRELEFHWLLLPVCLHAVVHSFCIACFFVSVRSRNPKFLVRDPVLTFIVQFGTLFAGVSIMLLNAYDYFPEILRRIYVLLILAFVFQPFVLKTWALFFRFALAESVLREMNYYALPKEQRKTGWFIKHRYLVSWPVLAFFEVFWVGICLTVHFLFEYGTDVRRYAQVALVSFQLLVVIVLVVLLKGKYDIWGVKDELLRVIFAATVLVLQYITLYVFPAMIDREIPNPYRDRISALANAAMMLGIALASTTFPDHWTLRKRITDLNSTANLTRVVTINEVLKDTELHVLFREYLKKELAVENITFIDSLIEFESQIKQLRSLDDAEKYLKFGELVSQKEKIVANFILDTSPASVNISSDVRRDIIRQAGNINVNPESMDGMLTLMSTLFNDAKTEILNLLTSDSIPRFMQSAEFQELKRNRVNFDIITVNRTSLPVGKVDKGDKETSKTEESASAQSSGFGSGLFGASSSLNPYFGKKR